MFGGNILSLIQRSMTPAILEQLTRRQLVVLDQLAEQLTSLRQLVVQDQRLLP